MHGRRRQGVQDHERPLHGQADFANPASDLDGPLTINARTVVSTADDLGYVTGSFRIKDDDTRFAGAFSGTLKGDKLVGFLAGVVAGQQGQRAREPERDVRAGHRLQRGSSRLEQLDPVLADRRRPGLQGSQAESKPEPKPASRSGRSSPAPPRVLGEVSAVGNEPSAARSPSRRRGRRRQRATRDATSPSTAGFPVGTRVLMVCEKVDTAWTLRKLTKLPTKG